MVNSVFRGAVAGLAGTTALNAATYLDMTLRARPASNTPEQTIAGLSRQTGIPVPGGHQERQQRLSGLGALLGIITGTAVGASYGAARTLGWRPSLGTGSVLAALVAMAGSSAPMAALGITNPRDWSTTEWTSDLLPHLAYGAATATTYELTDK